MYKIEKIKITGMGWVGKSMKQLFPNALVHDPAQGLIAEEEADICFVCVPSPLIEEGLDAGSLDTSIVEEVIATTPERLIVVRSTVNPGDCIKWAEKYDKHILMQPEFLGETPAHPMLDPKTRPFLVIGGNPEDRKLLIDLYTTVYNANTTIRQVSLYEAEVIKLTENRAIAFKVMQCHELYLACQKCGLDYYTIRDTVFGDDPRFNLWFSFIFPDNLGFESSKCLKKDVPAWCHWAKSLGFNPKVTQMLVDMSKIYANPIKVTNGQEKTEHVPASV